jgi:hypothetical protein
VSGSGDHHQLQDCASQGTPTGRWGYSLSGSFPKVAPVTISLISVVMAL